MTEQYKIKGVSVTFYHPNEKTDKAPIIMVHGGNLSSWCWEKWATFFSEAGYEVHVLDWYNHGSSDSLAEDAFIKRSIAAVAHEELTYIAEALDRSPIVMGHSMGGLAAALYAAEDKPLDKLVLVAPVMPEAAHPYPIPLPVDMSRPVSVFPYEQAKQLFFTSMSDDDAKKYYELLIPESPQAVSETVNWSLQMDPNNVKIPTLVVADELDRLIPQDALERYAELLHAVYKKIDQSGHCDVLLKDPQWRTAAVTVKEWLES